MTVMTTMTAMTVMTARRTLCHERRGVALFLVLVALTLLGALLAATATAVLHAQRSTRRAGAVAAASAAAEGARATAIAELPTRLAPDMAVGDTVAWDAASWNGAATRLSVTRLSGSVLRVESTATVPSGGGAEVRPAARWTTAALWSVQPAVVAIRAALTAGAPVIPGPGAGTHLRLDGRDTILAGWHCSAVDSASVPALATGAPVSFPPASLVGAVLTDPDAALPARYELTWPVPDTLRIAPAIIFASDLTSPPIAPRDAGVCLAGTAEPTNWGDPYRPSPCAGWLPLVRVRGNLDRPAGRGQGVLLVDGDLTLGGNFEFHGVVVVLGRLRATGVGNRVVGAVLALGDPARPHELDALELRYSSCAVRSALLAAGVLRPVSPRGYGRWW